MRHNEAQVHEAQVHEAQVHEAQVHEAQVHEAQVHEAQVHEAQVHEAQGLPFTKSRCNPSILASLNWLIPFIKVVFWFARVSINEF